MVWRESALRGNLGHPMLSAKVVMALLLSQYVRSRADQTDPNAQCLWWKEGTSITFQQHADGNPETPAETEFAAISASFGTWSQQLVACGSLRLQEGERTTSRVVAADDTRLVLFRQTDCDELVPACPSPDSCGNERDCWEHANGVLGLTTTSYDHQSGQITDSDIELNTRWFIFSTVDAPPCAGTNFNTGCVASDVQNTMTHEVGHLLGLGHSPALDSTMYARALPTELNKRALDADSKQFICNVYPAGQPSRACPAYDGVLGKASCQAVPAGELALLALLLLRRTRAPGAAGRS